MANGVNGTYGKKVNYGCNIESYDFSNEENLALGTKGTIVEGNSFGPIAIGDGFKSGGESVVFDCANDKILIKIYKSQYRTNIREAKIKYILDHYVPDDRLCWPLDILYYNNKFVGILMPRINNAIELDSFARNPKRLKKVCPNYSRIAQLDILINIIEVVEKLHNNNILLGDINAKNFLISKDLKNVFFIDLDSVQIGCYNSEMTTFGFDCPEVIISRGVQKYKEKDDEGEFKFIAHYSYFYRTFNQEYYALSVLFYKVLMFGKFPFDALDFNINEENRDLELQKCVEHEFPYGMTQEETNKYNVKSDNIWSHFPRYIKELFVKTFKENQRIQPEVWRKNFVGYRDFIKKNPINDKEINVYMPSNNLDYTLADINLCEEFIKRGFGIEHTLKVFARFFKDKVLNDNFKLIADNLKQNLVFNFKEYTFNVVYNIGVLSKIYVKKDII